MARYPNFYTYVKDVMVGIGGGSPVSYRYDPAAFATDNQGDIAQGEFCAWDATNQRVLRFNRSGANGKLIGVSRDDAAGLQKLGSQAGLVQGEISVFTSGIHQMVGTLGDTYSHGDAVYQSGTNTTTVTKTVAGGTQVGIVWNPLNASIVGAVRVPVLIDNFVQTQK